MPKEAKWVAIQKRTFTKWFNNHLSKKGYKPIKDIAKDWSSGIMLMNVVNALYGIKKPRKYNKKPKLRPHKLDNLVMAMDMLENKAEV
jgi:glycogen debranching enzyme